MWQSPLPLFSLFFLSKKYDHGNDTTEWHERMTVTSSLLLQGRETFSSPWKGTHERIGRNYRSSCCFYDYPTTVSPTSHPPIFIFFDGRCIDDLEHALWGFPLSSLLLERSAKSPWLYYQETCWEKTKAIIVTNRAGAGTGNGMADSDGGDVELCFYRSAFAGKYDDPRIRGRGCNLLSHSFLNSFFFI